MRGEAKIQALLLKFPTLQDVVECHGADLVENIMVLVADWLLAYPAGADLRGLLRRLKEDISAADPEPKERNFKT